MEFGENPFNCVWTLQALDLSLGSAIHVHNTSQIIKKTNSSLGGQRITKTELGPNYHSYQAISVTTMLCCKVLYSYIDACTHLIEAIQYNLTG